MPRIRKRKTGRKTARPPSSNVDRLLLSCRATRHEYRKAREISEPSTKVDPPRLLQLCQCGALNRFPLNQLLCLNFPIHPPHSLCANSIKGLVALRDPNPLSRSRAPALPRSRTLSRTLPRTPVPLPHSRNPGSDLEKHPVPLPHSRTPAPPQSRNPAIRDRNLVVPKISTRISPS